MLHRMHRCGVALVSCFLVVVAGCGDDTSSTRQSSSPTSSPVAEPTSDDAPSRPALFADAGPYAAGVQTLTAADGRRVVVWYPVEPSDLGAQPREAIDLTTFLPPDLASKVTPSPDTMYVTDAYRGAGPSRDGPFPLVLFSHGFAGFPEVYQFLTAHLATWGFVVAAPDHRERDLAAVLSGQLTAADEGAILLSALDAATGDSALGSIIDLDHVVAAGHSAGTRAATQAAADPRVDVVALYSPVTGLATTANPTLVMVGSDDKVTTAAAARSTYDALGSPKRLAVLTSAGHNTFTDTCTLGADAGGSIAIRAGVALPETVLALAADGCQEGALPITAAWPAIRHVTVAALRASLGIDDEPIGLDDEGLADLAPAEVVLTDG
jgi:dienelactone hydrolase